MMILYRFLRNILKLTTLNVYKAFSSQSLKLAMLIESGQDLFNRHIDSLALGFELHSLCVYLEKR